MKISLFALGIGFVLDLIIGDPHGMWHPVIAIGHWISACEKIGEICPRLAGADVTARIDVFPFFPVLFQFWEGDEEFSPQIRVLWDRNTMQYLHFETTYYLQGDLMERLQIIIEEMVTVQNRPNHLLMRP